MVPFFSPFAEGEYRVKRHGSAVECGGARMLQLTERVGAS